MIYTTSKTFLNSKMFYVFFFFFTEFSSAHQACIYLIQNIAKAVILWNILVLFKIIVFYLNVLNSNLFLWFQSWIFSINYSSHMILQKSFKYSDLLLKKHLLLLYYYYVENSWVEFFSGFFDEQKVQKNSIYLK